jgi:UDP-3-O-[3-hydroxymyristoyl] glucosamine N-acyltransferase
MEHMGFFHRAGPFPLRMVADAIGAELSHSADGIRTIHDVRSLRHAGPVHLTFFENKKYIGQPREHAGRGVCTCQRFCGAGARGDCGAHDAQSLPVAFVLGALRRR